MPDRALRLDRDFYARDTRVVARALLGQLLVHVTTEGRAAGRIVETEAYLGTNDLASHAARLRKGRVEVMWGESGIAYVYRSYGIHTMFNVVAERKGETGAVLIRALEPLDGVELMRQRRGVENEGLLCSGPGKLCQALAITLDMQGTDLVTNDNLWLAPADQPSHIEMSGRIGISRAKEDPWRYWIAANPHVSAHRRGIPFIE